MRVDGYDQHRVTRKGVSTCNVIFNAGLQRACLTVSDPDVFLATIVDGFGAAKAYGCGLMLIRRA